MIEINYCHLQWTNQDFRRSQKVLYIFVYQINYEWDAITGGIPWKCLEPMSKHSPIVTCEFME